MSISLRPRRYVAALLALALIGILPIPAAGAAQALPQTAEQKAPAAAPWWVDWLKAFDHDRDRIDDEAEALAERKPGGMVPVIVTFLDRDFDLAALVKAVGATAVAPFRTQPMVDLDIPASKLSRLSTYPGVVAVQHDRPLVPFLGVSTPATQSSNGSGANAHYNGSTAEDLGYTGQDMTVAVLDTGVQEQHHAFTGKYVAGTDVSPQIPVGTACVGAVDDQGHGTHVASTAIGNMPADGLPGTAKGGKVVEVRIAVGGATASLGPATIGSTNRGFEFVKLYNDRLAAGNPLCGPNDDHIDVATLSFGSLGRGGPNAGTTEPFIDALVNSGVAVTVAVGNCGPSPSSTCTFGDTDNGISSPGNAAGAIGVASFNDGGTVNRANDVISGFSSRGPNAGGTGDTTAGNATSSTDLQDRYRKPEIAAPGEAIQAAGPAPFLLSTSSGTSMATPHVAGIAALVLEAGEDVKGQTGGVNLMASTGNGYDASGAYVPGQYPVRDAIVNSAEYKEAGSLAKWTGPNSNGTRWNNAWGYGQVNAFGAVCWAWANVLAPGGATPPAPVSSKCTLSPDPDPTGSPTAEPSPTPTPTQPAGPSTTYYLHSLTGENTLDQAVDGAAFDTLESEFGPGEHSLAHDLTGFQNTTLVEVVDPTWRGTLDAPATSLSVDFWGEQIPDQDLGSINYLVRVLPEGATSYYELLPAISRPETDVGFVNVKHTFTSMRIGTGVEQPLELPAGPLTFTIRGTYAVDDAATTIAFDSTEYHSSFTINPSGSDPDPDPTVSPSVSPTPEPTPEPTATAFYLHSGSGVGQADRADSSSKFDAAEPTATEPSMFVDVPQLSNGAPQAIYDPYWTGRVGTRFSSLTLNFWQEQPLSDAGVRYSPSVWVGDTQYTLGAFSATPDENGFVSQTFTQYVKADGTRVDLSAIDPRGSDVTLTLPGALASTNGGTTAASSIVYDSVDRPSGFTIEPYSGPELPPGGGECDGTATQAKAAGERGDYTSAPNDPCFDKQWGMGIIGATDAWAAGATGHQVRVAVIDSGLDLGHPDFDCPDKIDRDKAAAVIDGKVLRGAKAQDIDGHGTHVAGIVGACTNNGTGVVGVAPDATLIPYRVFTTEEEGAGALNDIAVAIEQATDDGAHVINMSLGIGIGAVPVVGGVLGYAPELFPEIDQAIEYAQSQGVVVVIAAGNSFVLPLCEYPAIAEDALCVGSTDRNDLKSSFGTFPNKPPSGSPTADRPMGPSISAPGGIGNVVGLPQLCPESIFSTYMRSAESLCSTSGYDAIDGTSMASPHVAGAAALLYDRLGGARSAENRQLIVDRLLDTSKDLGTPGYDPVYGYGRLDALAAVDGFGSTEPVTVPTSLTVFDTPAAGQFSDDVRISARLQTAANGEPVEGKEITFQLVGDTETITWTATTGANGVAAATRTLGSHPGRYQLLASFAPGEESTYEASTDVEDFTIDREDSLTALTVGEAAGSGKDKSRALTATVADQDSAAGLDGVAVSFFCDGTLIATVQADSSGTASFDAPKNCANGSHEYRAVFEGDDLFIGSSDTRSS